MTSDRCHVCPGTVRRHESWCLYSRYSTAKLRNTGTGPSRMVTMTSLGRQTAFIQLLDRLGRPGYTGPGSGGSRQGS